MDVLVEARKRKNFWTFASLVLKPEALDSQDFLKRLMKFIFTGMHNETLIVDTEDVKRIQKAALTGVFTQASFPVEFVFQPVLADEFCSLFLVTNCVEERALDSYLISFERFDAEADIFSRTRSVFLHLRHPNEMIRSSVAFSWDEKGKLQTVELESTPKGSDVTLAELYSRAIELAFGAKGS